MLELSTAARQVRLDKYTTKLKGALASHIIDCDKPAFAALRNDKGQKMSSLDGAILLGLDLAEDGTLRGVLSIDVDDLVAQLPELKRERLDASDKMGFKKHLDRWEGEGLDVLVGVDVPDADEYALTAVEELVTVDIRVMSDFEAKQKLLELQERQRSE